MKFIITNKKSLVNLKDLSVTSNIKKVGNLQVISEENVTEVTKGCFLVNDGYIRDWDKKLWDHQGQKESVVTEICGQWPLADHISGSFSATVINVVQERIILCTDQVGLYPLYYVKNGEDFLISNSIIWIGAVSGSEFDDTGVAQRCLGPEFENLGSRTILKNCKRLLPGECLRFDLNGNLLVREYDNRLYANMSSANQDHDLWKEYWKAFKEEVKYAVNYSPKVNVALSGGIDSRVILGAVPEEKQVNCFTFGNPDNYESKVASRLAKLKGASFTACHDPSVYFPAPEKLEDYTLRTEAVELCSWLEITEQVGGSKDEPLLLGELCEALPGRKIERFSSRSFRQKNFFKYYIRGKDYSFEEATDENFALWKENTLKRFRIYYHERKLSKLNLQSDKEILIPAMESDMEEIFARIEAHRLPYVELYDELFSWYTYTRMRLSKQLLLAGSIYNAYSPAMSLQMLTRTSNLHPNIRLNYRFAKKLFKNQIELQKLYRVPTSQAPLVPQNFPDILKFAMWGFRSKADQALTKRMVRKKNSFGRYRLFKSMNWAQVYQHPFMEQNLHGYFSKNNLGETFFKELLQQALLRKNLEQWPFANINILSAASLNTEMNLIKKFQKL